MGTPSFVTSWVKVSLQQSEPDIQGSSIQIPFYSHHSSFALAANIVRIFYSAFDDKKREYKRQCPEWEEKMFQSMFCSSNQTTMFKFLHIVFSVDLVFKEELNPMLVEASQGAVGLR